MKRKLISAVALIMCAIMFLFCGCKSKKNGDDTTAPPRAARQSMQSPMKAPNPRPKR